MFPVMVKSEIMKCHCGSLGVVDIYEEGMGIIYIKQCKVCTRKYTQLGVDAINGTYKEPFKPEKLLLKSNIEKKTSRKVPKKKKQAANQSEQLKLR